jgi:hypothetical protein
MEGETRRFKPRQLILAQTGFRVIIARRVKNQTAVKQDIAKRQGFTKWLI